MNEVLISRKHRVLPDRTSLKRLLWGAAGSVALGGLFAWSIEEHWLRIERRRMALPHLDDALTDMRLVHISDLHACPIVRERYLYHCVEMVNRLEPDFVAVTGDFITGPAHYARVVARVLRHLTPRIAVVACLGNHDYGACHPRGFGQTRGLADYVADCLMHEDVFVMRNESRRFDLDGACIQFVGLEDYWAGSFRPDEAFELARDDLPTICLCHNPDGAHDVAERGAHWVLSGHTHGQAKRDTKFYNFVLPANHHHLAAGEYVLDDGARLYINRGLGYARRMNINTRPEITLFTLQRADAHEG
ncbi:MAG: metallophosphoesterase [Phycisphaerae bacterium]|nr:metallophosphoesterase [Phycisphaerae bacterium]